MKCAIYLRPVTKETLTLEQKEALIAEVAKVLGTEVSIYEESNPENDDEFLRLIEDIEASFLDAVWTQDIDQLVRDDDTAFFVQHLFNEHGIDFYVNGELYKYQQQSELSQDDLKRFESLRLKARLRRGKVKKKNSGQKVHYRFYGYNLADGQMVVNLSEADTVRHIYKLFNEEQSYKQIAESLMLEGHKRKNGSDSWNDSFIKGILSKPEYIGFSYNTDGELIESKTFPSILDRDVWNTAQERLSQFVSNTSEDIRVRRYALSGVIKCGNCGSGFYVRGSTKYSKDLITEDNPKGKYIYHFFHHRPLSKTALECSTTKTSFKMETVENLVVAIYISVFSDQEIKAFIRMDEEERKREFLKSFEYIKITDGILDIKAATKWSFRINLRDIPVFWKHTMLLLENGLSEWKIARLERYRRQIFKDNKDPKRLRHQILTILTFNLSSYTGGRTFPKTVQGISLSQVANRVDTFKAQDENGFCYVITTLKKGIEVPSDFIGLYLHVHGKVISYIWPFKRNRRNENIFFHLIQDKVEKTDLNYELQVELAIQKNFERLKQNLISIDEYEKTLNDIYLSYDVNKVPNHEEPPFVSVSGYGYVHNTYDLDKARSDLRKLERKLINIDGKDHKFVIDDFFKDRRLTKEIAIFNFYQKHKKALFPKNP